MQDFCTPEAYINAYKSVRIFVLSNRGSQQDVEDVLQEGFYRFFEQIKKPDFELTSTLEAFIYGVCKNIWLSELKKHKLIAEDCFPIDEFATDDFDTLELKLRNERLLTIIDRNIKRLSQKCQEIFRYRKEGLSCGEIAAKMNWKDRKISKDKFYRCKRKLLEHVYEDTEFINLDHLDNR